LKGSAKIAINIIFLLLILHPFFLFSEDKQLLFPEQEDSLISSDFVLDEAFMKELANVIDYDSTDFLTWELNYYEDILKQEPRLEEFRLKAQSYLNNYSIFSKNNNFKEALESYKSYLTFKDSINTIQNARNISDLNKTYETYEKQKNIEILNQDNELNNLKLESRKQVKWIMIFASLFLVFFLIAFIIFVRIKFLKNKKLRLEVAARRKAKKELLTAKEDLEEQVVKRRSELISTNEQLQNEITEIEKIQQKILRAERLTVVGEMASGMINVIEEPVRSISLSVQNYLDKFTDAEGEPQEMAEILVKTSHKVNNTLHSLQQFSLSGKINWEKTDINKIINNTITLFKAKQYGRKISFSKQISASIPKLKLDKVKLESILINLVLNAIDSISDEGNIKITSRKYKDQVVMKITDTGAGISKDNIGKVFNPFFTTKERGFGLGLSIVHQYIRAMKGSISISSKPAKGTEIRISFPVGQDEE